MHSNLNQSVTKVRRTQAVRFALCLAVAGTTLIGPIACAVAPAVPPKLESPEIYRIGAPDRLEISVLPDPAIERSVLVRPDGKISLDLIGDVQAAGLTTEEIAEVIRVQIARYKRNPLVTVRIVSAESDTISLFGEVRSPGTFALRHEIRIAEAIAQFGGTTNFASKRYVRVIRTEKGETVIYKVNLSRIQAGDLSSNIQLQSGDIVVVPPTILARIGYMMQQLLFPFQPIIQAGGSYNSIKAIPGI